MIRPMKHEIDSDVALLLSQPPSTSTGRKRHVPAADACGVERLAQCHFRLRVLRPIDAMTRLCVSVERKSVTSAQA
jgi:hypothetical protein